LPGHKTISGKDNKYKVAPTNPYIKIKVQFRTIMPPSKVFCKSMLLLGTLLLGATDGFCNWGPDGSGATSVCEGGAQGGDWCNASPDNCESGCGGKWCTSPDVPPDTPPDTACPAGYTAASWTTYTSYAACCQDSPNYDPNADTTECDLYNACAYTGDFAYIGHQSYEYVSTNNLVAFFSTHGDNASYGNQQIRVLMPSSGQTVDALVADTCGDSDCNGCCTTNAQPSGYLVDMEYWTVVNNFGADAVASGQVCWKLVDDAPAPTTPVASPIASPVQPTPVTSAPVPSPPVGAPVIANYCGSSWSNGTFIKTPMRKEGGILPPTRTVYVCLADSIGWLIVPATRCTSTRIAYRLNYVHETHTFIHSCCPLILIPLLVLSFTP
jgi:hypothetical protein